jgi:sortase (surface protein transpeptidase)
MFGFSIPTGNIELYAHEIYRSRIYIDLRKIEDGNSIYTRHLSSNVGYARNVGYVLVEIVKRD